MTGTMLETHGVVGDSLEDVHLQLLLDLFADHFSLGENGSGRSFCLVCLMGFTVGSNSKLNPDVLET